MSAKGSTLKRVRQSRKANDYNNHYKSMMKTSIKKILDSSSKEDAESLKNEAFKIIDKLLYISGQLPIGQNGEMIKGKMKVVTPESVIIIVPEDMVTNE